MQWKGTTTLLDKAHGHELAYVEELLLLHIKVREKLVDASRIPWSISGVELIGLTCSMKLHPTCPLSYLEHITMVQFLLYLCHFDLHSFGYHGNMQSTSVVTWHSPSFVTWHYKVIDFSWKQCQQLSCLGPPPSSPASHRNCTCVHKSWLITLLYNNTYNVLTCKVSEA